MSWKVIPQGCPAAPNLRTLIQGPGHGHILLTGLPPGLRAHLTDVIMDELNDIDQLCHESALGLREASTIP